MGELENVTIIIVNWNCEALIQKQIQYLSELDTAQIIIVDNSDSYEFEDPAIEVLRGHGNIGFGNAINLALGRALNDLVVLLNPDVEISVDTLGKLYLSWISRGGSCVFSPLSIHSDGTNGSWGKKEFPSLYHDLMSLVGGNLSADLQRNSGIHQVSYCSGACWMVSKSLLEEHNGFDADFFLYFEETELSFRLQRSGVMSYIDTDLTYTHDESQTMNSVESKAFYFIESKIKYFLKTKKYPKPQLFVLVLIECLMYLKSCVRGRSNDLHVVYAKQILKTLL